MSETTVQTRLNLNGRWEVVEVDPDRTLLEVLRSHFRLTGTKYNCEQGECGACTVLIDGRPVNSCITLAFSVEGSEVRTIEGLETDGGLDSLQTAFIDFDAAQCGYCTPGMIMASKGLLLDNPHPDAPAIRQGLQGNYCRCTGYGFILEAVASVASAQCERPCETGCSTVPPDSPSDQLGDGS